uniref:Myosin tail domain-containing protein n=1 Tax=Scophthalmus maximus TaxID=52904 RepID=A0A8D3BUX0_SCOMX
MSKACWDPELQRNGEDVTASVEKLQQLIDDNVLAVPPPVTQDRQVCEEEEPGREGLWRFAVWSDELTFDLRQLQKRTERELSDIHTQLSQFEGRRQLLSAELLDLHEKKKQIERELRRSSRLQTSTVHLCAGHELRASITQRLVQSEALLFQEEALSALRDLLTQDLQRYREETARLSGFTRKILRQSHRSDGEETFSDRRSDHSMQGKNETEPGNNMRTPESSSSHSNAEEAWRASHKKPAAGPSRSSNLRRAGSVKDLISRFSDDVYPSGAAAFGGGRTPNSACAPEPPKSKSPASAPSGVGPDGRPVPRIAVTPPLAGTARSEAQRADRTSARSDGPAGGGSETDSSKTQTADSGSDSVTDSGVGSETELESNKQPDSPSEDEPTTPRAVPPSQNPKYQLFLNNDLIKTNGLSGRDGGGGSATENGPRLAPWESNRLGMNHYRGSLESLASREWDTMPDRVGIVDSPPRVFNSPYATTASMDYNPMYRMSEFKGLSPATSDMNLFSYNSRSTSPVGLPTPTLTTQRPRFSTFETLRRRNEVNNPQVVPSSHYSLRSNTLGAPNRKDYIEELTKQMDACQKRNQFLEAESVEMEKERNQIRFEMRSLLVNNEDLLRTNTQLTNEMKRMREQMVEMERESQTMSEKFREMEIEVREAREVMVEANTQEYAFNFLQQSLKNRIQDAEENLDKQTLHAQTLAEKLWLAERQLEDLEVDKETKDKKTSELNSTLLRLESEVSGKLIDKERTLEEEIQLRERIQLQCKQAERAVDDLHMELQSTNQARDDLSKQLKQAQEKLIDLESDLEELQDSEQRWAAKHKRAIEQTEQLQLKVIQEKDLNDQLEMDKTVMDRQLRELRLEVDELQSSRVQEDVVSRAESRAKELESLLRTEERNKAVLTNAIGKLERRINELTDQMEEEHRLSNEQKDLMTQRMRSLKRQLNEVEEEASRKEALHRHTQRELAEERESSGRLQRQLLEQHQQTKRKETLTIRQTLDNLRLDLSVDDEDDEPPQQTETVTKV